MIKRRGGFTIVELLVAMVMFVFAISAASQIFTKVLTQFKQQSKIAETELEGIIGLELLRRDVKHAGYGLPRTIPAGVVYSEADTTYPAISMFNDCSGTGPCPAPRPVLNGEPVKPAFTWSDDLVIKATNLLRNLTAHKWTRLSSDGTRRNGLSGDLFYDDGTEYVTVIEPGEDRTLVDDSTVFYTTYNNTANFVPRSGYINVIYGLKQKESPGAVVPRMPFNRADYYISTDTDGDGSDDVPARCAPGTGVLVKRLLRHDSGLRDSEGLPLLDCVADFQVTFWLDTDDNGTVDSISNDIVSDGLTAAQLIDRLKEVRIYIVAQAGQKDIAFDYSESGARTKPDDVTEKVGGATLNNVTFVDLSGPSVIGSPEYKYYRWKLYTLVVTPESL